MNDQKRLEYIEELTEDLMVEMASMLADIFRNIELDDEGLERTKMICEKLLWNKALLGSA